MEMIQQNLAVLGKYLELVVGRVIAAILRATESLAALKMHAGPPKLSLTQNDENSIQSLGFVPPSNVTCARHLIDIICKQNHNCSGQRKTPHPPPKIPLRSPNEGLS